MPSDGDLVGREDEDVLRRVWVLERLVELGFGTDDALELLDHDVDWHDFEGLIAAGCPPALAKAILL